MYSLARIITALARLGLLCAALVVSCTVVAEAQSDTTFITIYGSRFAPGARVLINGTPITDVSRVTYISSKQLKVRVPPEYLVPQQTPPVLQLNKSGTGTISSGGQTLLISVKNPDITRGVSNAKQLYLQSRSKIYITFSDTTVQKTALSKRLKNLFVYANNGKDTTVKLNLWYENLAVEEDISLLIRPKQVPQDVAYFQILDSIGNPLTTVTGRQSSTGFIPIRIKFSNQAQPERTKQVQLQLQANSVNDAQDVDIQGVTSPPEYRILVAYTLQSSENFIVKNGASDRIQDPKQFLKNCLILLNTELSKIIPTRFTFIQEPVLVTSYMEHSPIPDLHADIDGLKNQTLSEINTAVANDGGKIDAVILLVNSATTPYQAIVSDCANNKIPGFVVVEAKYARIFINPENNIVNNIFLNQLVTVIRGGQ